MTHFSETFWLCPKNRLKMSNLPVTPYDTVCISGGFDPVHVGHLRLIKEAAQFGKLIVIVNSDEWLMRKKGYIFMPFEERCEILCGFAGVEETVAVDDLDGTVCEALTLIKPTYFANGGDRESNNTPEIHLCEKLGIELLWYVGGHKVQSSDALVQASPMLAQPLAASEEEEDLLRPSRVEIVTAHDVPKSLDREILKDTSN